MIPDLRPCRNGFYKEKTMSEKQNNRLLFGLLGVLAVLAVILAAAIGVKVAKGGQDSRTVDYYVSER